ncbi:Glycosyl hydrolases family 43 [Mucilaginibacter lappiensis]|uniref:Glycosyl hydrolases family 43 n=1 Tax=Mucilaginibacter lappiensis TaxID=354630 RepID=A0ABR6PGT8_9SPHI|nr:family 43 glycosylhydrolase [Mucilaginibacter lappiensis]MBB6108479.1 hypothetical protein [Mucilaginibacter lappiensis]SIQ36394.1 Glycosyl hydrolases family 43 [Mucilaginibacter lappiensis]
MTGLLLTGQILLAQDKTINPGAIWPDSDGNHIQAHGGGIIKIKGTYFWYGEERRKGLDSNFRYVSCYSSTDLINWKFRNDVVKMSDPENLGKGWILERPKVFFNAETKKYVMYFHLDDVTYQYARVGIAISDRADGNFRFVKSLRPLGRPSRDIGQFIDDDGSAFLIFEDRELGFHIAQLSADYMNVEKEMCLIKMPLEGGALVHFEGLYYVIGSQLSGWAPNPNKYATSKTLTGPWTAFNDIAPPGSNTYQSQSTMMLKVVGTNATAVIFMADQWNPSHQSDSRYLWMPLEIGKGKLWLPKPQPWTIDLKEGAVKLVSKKQ